jgi:hypothetical protein
MDYASNQAQAKRMSPTASHDGGHTEAAVARHPKASPPPTTDVADNMYNQLAVIHTISTMKLVECVHWSRSNPTPNAVHIGAAWRGLIVEPSTARMAPPPLTNFAPKASLWQ